MGLFDAATAAANNTMNIGMGFLQNKWNRDAVTKAYERDIDMWNAQNAYNTPAAQMQRYRDAGLNPMLIYGSGSASAGNASSSVHSSVPRLEAPRIDLPEVLTSMNLIKDLSIKNKDLELKDALIDKTKNDSSLSFAKGLTEDMRRILYGIQGGGYLLDNRLKSSLIDSQVDLFQQRLKGEYLRNVYQFELNKMMPDKQRMLSESLKMMPDKQRFLSGSLDLQDYNIQNVEVRNRLLEQQFKMNESLNKFGLRPQEGGILGAPLKMGATLLDLLLNSF